MRVCLVTAEETVERAVTSILGADSTLTVFHPTAIRQWDDGSQDDDMVIEAIVSCDVILVNWDVLVAPVIAALHMRTTWSNVPVIAICTNDAGEQAMALLAGAASVVTFPAQLALLKALMMAHHRTRESARVMTAVQLESDNTEAPRERPTLSGRSATLELDAETYRCFVGEHEVNLTARQFALLEFLVQNQGVVVSRDRLLKEVWNYDFDPGSNVVDVYIHYLRNVLEAHGLEGVIQTVRGKGYRYESYERETT